MEGNESQLLNAAVAASWLCLFSSLALCGESGREEEVGFQGPAVPH